jgi:hypothetical protein
MFVLIAVVAIGFARGLASSMAESAAEAATPVIEATQSVAQPSPTQAAKPVPAAPKPDKTWGTWGSQPLPNKGHLGLTPVQLWNASLITKVAQDLGLPRRAAEIAIATAHQECQLYNCANDNLKFPLVLKRSLALPHEGVGHDNDSVGLFQQRPSYPEGELPDMYGTVAELMDKVTATKKFYAKLLKVWNWQSLPLTVAAQAVQNSSYPDRYADDEAQAIAVVKYVTQFRPVI